MTFQEALDVLRRFQRHRLLREYGTDGQVLPENITVSAALLLTAPFFRTGQGTS